MLKRLKVEHFAIIDAIDVTFHDGMTVMTGETGAGKSILIDALSLLLGDRANQDMIRSGENSAFLHAEFEVDSDEIKFILKQEDIDYRDTLTIERTLSNDNKNKVEINEQTTTLQILKKIGKHLADVHSQFDTQRLINPGNYLAMIDGFKKSLAERHRNDYRTSLSVYQEKMKAYLDLKNRQKNLEDKLEMYHYQLEELNRFEFDPDREKERNEQINLLENFDSVYQELESIRRIFDEFELTDKTYQVLGSIRKLSEMTDEFSEIRSRFNDIYYEMDDLEKELIDKAENINFDPNELSSLQEESFRLERIKEKYNKSTEELAEYKTYLNKSINEATHYDDLLEEAKTAVKIAYEDLLKKALSLRQMRKEVGKRITHELTEVLDDLVLPDTQFEIVFSDETPQDPFDQSAFTQDGIDQVDFLISTNVGEPLKPLSKTASGGEMSRIMLAFKTIFLRGQQLSTIIFDEIDTGISGHVAKEIAKKIKEISRMIQVISITHNPQVVATGTHHIRVRKITRRKRTNAHVAYLDFNERIEEIAKMISGESPSDSSMESAKELLLDA